MRPAHSPHDDTHEQWIIETSLWPSPTCDSCSDPREWSLEIASTCWSIPCAAVSHLQISAGAQHLGSEPLLPKFWGLGGHKEQPWPACHICALARMASPESCHQRRINFQITVLKQVTSPARTDPPSCLTRHAKQCQNGLWTSLKLNCISHRVGASKEHTDMPSALLGHRRNPASASNFLLPIVPSTSALSSFPGPLGH